MERVAIVTGANRGLGLEVCKQLASKDFLVVLTSRDEVKGKKSVDSLHEEGLTNIFFHQLDVTNIESIKKLENYIVNKLGQVDILVNNAAIYLDKKLPQNSSILMLNTDTLNKTIETNLYGQLNLCQTFAPMMIERSYGRIVNVSSIAGQLTSMRGRHPAYRISKVAINALTRILASELEGTHVLVNAVCPGWVKTDLGGPNATRTVEEGASTVVWLATLPNDGPSGLFFRDNQPIDW